MSDEATLVVGLLGGMAALIVVLLRYQRRKEARLVAQTDIELPIQSVGKAAAIIAASMIVPSVLAGVVAALINPGPEHAVAAVFLVLALSVACMFVGVKLSYRYACIGRLSYTPRALELQLGAERWQIELGQAYELDEGLAFGPKNMPLQVLVVRQEGRELAFSYGLPLGRKHHGDRTFDRYPRPAVGSEARVIHDRLRRRTAR